MSEESYEVMSYDLGLCHITFKILLWRFLCSLIDMLYVVVKRGFTLQVISL